MFDNSNDYSIINNDIPISGLPGVACYCYSEKENSHVFLGGHVLPLLFRNLLAVFRPKSLISLEASSRSLGANILCKRKSKQRRNQSRRSLKRYRIYSTRTPSSRSKMSSTGRWSSSTRWKGRFRDWTNSRRRRRRLSSSSAKPSSKKSPKEATYCKLCSDFPRGKLWRGDSKRTIKFKYVCSNSDSVYLCRVLWVLKVRELVWGFRSNPNVPSSESVWKEETAYLWGVSWLRPWEPHSQVEVISRDFENVDFIHYSSMEILHWK